MWEFIDFGHQPVCCHSHPPNTSVPGVAKVYSWLRLLNSPGIDRAPEAYAIEEQLLTSYRKRNPQFSIAAAEWPDHAGIYWETLGAQITDLFTTADSFNFVQWALEYAREKHLSIFKSGTVASAHAVIDLTAQLCNGTVSPLHMAALLGIPGLCQDLISRGADIQQDSSIGTPLFCALVGPAVLQTGTNPAQWLDVFMHEANSDRVDTILHLIDTGADCTFTYRVGRTDDSDDFEEFAERQDDDDTLNKFDASLAGLGFWAASISGSAEVFEWVVRGGAAIDKNLLFVPYARELFTCSSTSTLQCAFFSLLDLTIESSSNMTSSQEDEIYNMVDKAIDEFHFDITDVGRLEYIDDQVFPLRVRSAIVENQPLCLQRLILDTRFDPDLPAGPSAEEGTIAHLAVSGDRVLAADMLVQAGSDFSLRDGKGRTPLMVSESPWMLQLLSETHHLPTTDVDNEGRTIWHYAAATNDGPCMCWLCDSDPSKEINMRVKTHSGRTPLDETFHYVNTLSTEPLGSPQGPAVLLKLLPAMLKHSQTPPSIPARLAVAWGTGELMDDLLAAGARFGRVDVDGNTMLHHLNFSATPRLIKRLSNMAWGLPVGNSKGHTPAETIFTNTIEAYTVENDVITPSAYPGCHDKLYEETYNELLTPVVLQYRDYMGRGIWERFSCVARDMLIRLEKASYVAHSTFFDSLMTGLNCLIRAGAMKDYERRTGEVGLYCFQMNRDDGRLWDAGHNIFLEPILRNSDKALLKKFYQTEEAYILLVEAWDDKQYGMIALLASTGLPLHMKHSGLHHRSFIEVVLTEDSNDVLICLDKLLNEIQTESFVKWHDRIFDALFRPNVTFQRQKLRMLLDKGLNPNSQPSGLVVNERQHYLPAAILSGRYKMALMMLKRGADPRIGFQGCNALIAAAGVGDFTLVARIIQVIEGRLANFDWNGEYKNSEGVTFNALQMATHHGHDRVLLLLLERTPLGRGAINNVTSHNLLTPAHLAALGGWSECMRVLYSRNADMTLLDGRGRTPLQVAIQSEKMDLVSALIESIGK